MSADKIRDREWGRPKSGRIKRIVRRSIDGARQLMYPGVFRIKESPELVAISKDVLLGPAAVATAKSCGTNLDADSKHLLRSVAAVATAIWRMRAKLEAESSAELPYELRHLPRHVQAAWDALASGGIEVPDHKGQRYVPGMAVNPVTYSPDSTVPPNTIVETLKPSVFWKDILIQRADVILASPEDGTARDPDPVQPLPSSPSAAPTQPTSQGETSK